MSGGDPESVQDCKDFSKNARRKARKMSCKELLDKINELSDREKSGRMGTKGLKQRFRDYKGDDATHGPFIFDQQRSLRTYIDEYTSRGCGDPPGNAVELAERALPAPAAEPEREGITGKDVAVVGGGIAAGYVVYRVVRFLPSLLAWPTIPANLAIP